MSTAVMTEKLNRPQPVATSPDDAVRVQQILSRADKTRPGFLAGLALTASSAVLLWASFAPLDWGALAWVALVPLLLLTKVPQRTDWMYRIVFAGGCLYWIISLQWMRLGDPSMILALLALGIYLALYWPLFLALTRVAVHRWRLPLVFAAPLMWTGLEYLRGFLMTGFSWYQMGHSQHGWIDLIQVSDLFGGYAVTFLVLAGNAALVELIPTRWIQRIGVCSSDGLAWMQSSRNVRLQTGSVCLVVGLVLLSLAYGRARRPEQFPLGPRVGLVQGNFVASLRTQEDPLRIYNMHRQLTALTVAEQPDLIVWPEAMFPYGMQQVDAGVTDEQLEKLDSQLTVERWRSQEPQKALADLADMTNAAMIIGLTVLQGKADRFELFNSAILVQPGMGIIEQYNKIHRVPFGEYIPLRDSLPFLQSLTPFRGRFGIDAGQQAKAFQYKEWILVPTICFEDTVPHLVHDLARKAGVNDSAGAGAVLVNISNDGWFHGSSELEQHLVSSKFRAIETRTPMIRAANTGISAVIDGDGVVREPLQFFDIETREQGLPARTTLRDPRTGRFHKQLNCAQVVDVPLDPRSSFYVATGDWFAAACLLACCAAGLGGAWPAKRQAMNQSISA